MGNQCDTVGNKTSPEISPSILDSIGNTPLVRLNRIPQSFGIKCEVLAKCELFNPGGCHKDRVAREMILDSERTGSLKPGYTIVYPSTGNSGIAASLVAAVKGYKIIVVIPEKCCTEKIRILRSLGAELIRVKFGDDNISQAERIHQNTPNSILLNQYTNVRNRYTHSEETGREILVQCSGQVDMIVAAVGSAGSLMGLSNSMKSKRNKSTCIVVGVDPKNSHLGLDPTSNFSIPNGELKPWLLEVGTPGRVPSLLDYKRVDKWFKCGDKEAFLMTRRIIREEGILVGPTSGAVLCGAIHAIQEMDLKENQRCVIIFGDGARNYMSTLMSDEWMEQKFCKSKTETSNVIIS